MNFLRYDPTTGAIISQGYMDALHLDAEIASGAATIRVTGWTDPTLNIVDPTTKTIVVIPK